MSRRLFGTVSAIAAASSVAFAQTPTTSITPVLTAGAVPLSLGDAARLAARQSAISRGARLRADEAGARVRESRSELLPNLSSYVQEAGRTFNTSTLGIDFPATPGNPPLFDPQGQVEGPINTLDVRGRVEQNLLDFGALGRVRSAQANSRA
jgi:outer membrane protein TolC